MSDYQRLMMEAHREAMGAYSFDPRERFEATRRTTRTIETFGETQPTTTPTVPEQPPGTEEDDISYANEKSIQEVPATRMTKRYIIIDASQRDWVNQPNPYTNLVFSFGSQTTVVSNPPVYTNDSFIPTFAVEQSNLPTPIPGLPNLQGWTLAAGTSNIRYPAYNSSLLPGTFIAYDTGYVIRPSGSGFGSSTNLSSVASMRLVRAVLPQRQFLSIPIDPSSNSPDYATSQFIQSNLVGKSYSTFATYPYLLFGINEFFGQYLGGNDQIRRSFSVMTQKQRQQANFQTDVGVQQYDYEPWGEEALTFQSPITTLKRVEISVTDPIGTTFAQSDGLTIQLMQATDNSMYLKCFTADYQYFSSNELRVGDRVTFYGPTISNMLKSPILAVLPSDKFLFIRALSNATFPVLQLLDYVADSNGIYEPRSSTTARTKPYVSSYNGFIIPNFVTVGLDGTASASYPNSIDAGTSNVLEPATLLGYLTTDLSQNTLPFLNTSLQPVYTLELVTVEPDTTAIGGGKIVVPR
jgi:hypothetical protein